MQNQTGGGWGYPKLDFGSNNSAASFDSNTSPHGKSTPMSPVAKSTFEQLMALKVDENALEQLDKVAMFFNSQMPATASPDSNSIYRTLPNSPITPMLSSTASAPLGRSFGPVLDSDVAMSIREVFAARTVSHVFIACTNVRSPALLSE
jgi:hypothetical protein